MKSKHIKTFEKFFLHIELLNLDKRSQIVCARDFNFFFNFQLEATRGNPSFKSKSVSKFYEISETLGLCDIWRVINREKKDSLSVKKDFPGVIKKNRL